MSQATDETPESVGLSAAATHASAGSRAGGRLIAAIFLLAILPVIAAPILPTIDYYSHVARYYVLSHLGSDPFLAENYASRWAILPNIGIDIIGTALTAFMPALLAAKLLTIGVFATQYFGLLYFNRQLTGRVSLIVALLGVPLLYSFIFTWGFANFLLGLGLVFWGAGWWLKQRERLWIAIPTASVLALAIFFSHGVAFVLYGLLLGGLELGYFWVAERRSLAALATKMGALAVQAVAPAAFFMMSPTVKASEGVTNADEAIGRLAKAGQLGHKILDLATYRLATIVRVSDGPYPWFQAAINVLILTVILAMIWRGRAKITRLVWPALAITAVLMVCTPPAMFRVGFVADRIPLFAAMLLVGALTVVKSDARRDVPWPLLVAGLVGLQLITTIVGWLPYQRDFADFRAVSARIAPHSVVGFVDLVNDQRLDSDLRCEMYGPLLIPLYGQVSPIWAEDTAQPVSIVGPLQAAMESQPDGPPMPPGVERAAAQLQAMIRDRRYDYVLVCDPGRIEDHSAAATLVARRGRFTLLRLSPRSTER